MEKIEFNYSLNEELYELDIEEKKLNKKIEFYYGVGSDSYENEILEAKKQIQIINRKREKLKDFIGFSSYARIMTMSHSEIEKYKEEKIAALNDEIEIVESKLRQEKTNKEELEESEKNLLNKYLIVNDYEKEDILEVARGIKARLDDMNSSNSIQAYNEEIDKINKKIEEIKNSSDEEIKKNITKLIDNNYNSSQLYEWYKSNQQSNKNKFAFLASLDEDSEEISQLSDIVCDYASIKFLLDSQKEAKLFNSRSNNSIQNLINDLPITDENGLTPNYHFMPLEKVLVRLEKYEDEFKRDAEYFKFDYMFDFFFHFRYLHNANYADPERPDLKLFKAYSDILSTTDINRLIEISFELKKIENKMFRTKTTRELENELNDEADKLTNKIYEDLTNKLDIIFKNITLNNRSHSTSFSDMVTEYAKKNLDMLYDDHQYTDKIKKYITDTKNKIGEAKESLQSSIKYNNNIIYEKEKELSEVENRYKEFFKNYPLDASIASIEEMSNLFAGTTRNIYEIKLKEKIKEEKANKEKMSTLDNMVKEAQEESNNEEANIRGITLEELLEQRRRALEEKQMLNNENSSPKLS